MKGFYGSGSKVVKILKGHRILFVGGRVQLSTNPSTGSRHKLWVKTQMPFSVPGVLELSLILGPLFKSALMPLMHSP